MVIHTRLLYKKIFIISNQELNFEACTNHDFICKNRFISVFLPSLTYGISMKIANNTCLENTPASKAWNVLSTNPFRTWPMRSKIHNNVNRLESFPILKIDVPTIKRDTKLLTLGSCFANNLLKYISFFSVNSLNRDYIQNCSQNEIQWTNIYNPLVFLEFIKMAREIHQNGVLSERSCNLGFFEKENKAIDLMFTIERQVDFENAQERQQKRTLFFKNFMTKVFEADVIILTFGLVECWYDTLYEGYINVAPNPSQLGQAIDRFEFQVLEYNQIVAAIQEIIDIIQTFGQSEVKFIMSISPVPLLATFRPQDVIISNMYSKSLLRVSIEPFVSQYSNVFYFPSYEIVSYASVENFWTNDLRHVTPKYIVRIVNMFSNASLTPEEFPFLRVASCTLFALTELLSKTEDTPTNMIREIGVGVYSSYPCELSDDLALVIEQEIENVSSHMNQNTKALLFAKLLLAIKKQQLLEAKNLYMKIVSEYILMESFEVAIIAGYGLLLKEPRSVLKVLNRFNAQHHELWQVYYHYFLAYLQLNEHKKALEKVNSGIKNENISKWILRDHRAKNFIDHACKIAEICNDSHSLDIFQKVKNNAVW